MKKTIFTAIFSLFTVLLFAQVQVDVPYQGAYNLIPNEKVSYDFNKVIVDETSMTLLLNEEIIRSLLFKSYDEKSGYYVSQTFPVLSEDMRQYGELNLRVDTTSEGHLHVLVNGPGSNAEHFLKKVTN